MGRGRGRKLRGTSFFCPPPPLAWKGRQFRRHASFYAKCAPHACVFILISGCTSSSIRNTYTRTSSFARGACVCARDRNYILTVYTLPPNVNVFPTIFFFGRQVSVCDVFIFSSIVCRPAAATYTKENSTLDVTCALGYAFTHEQKGRNKNKTVSVLRETGNLDCGHLFFF